MPHAAQAMPRNQLARWQFAGSIAWFMLVWALTFASPTIRAQTPVSLTLHYQGQLSTASATPITATLNITFSLYAASSGGSPLWTESQSVAVTNGTYNVTLGQTVALTAGLFTSPLFFGIKIGSDAELTPRLTFSSVPYSMQSGGIVACSSGITNCSGTCANLSTNASNCGACGTACASGHPCVARICQ